jgi:hypothetical protein
VLLAQYLAGYLFFSCCDLLTCSPLILPIGQCTLVATASFAAPAGAHSTTLAMACVRRRTKLAITLTVHTTPRPSPYLVRPCPAKIRRQASRVVWPMMTMYNTSVPPLTVTNRRHPEQMNPHTSYPHYHVT